MRDVAKTRTPKRLFLAIMRHTELIQEAPSINLEDARAYGQMLVRRQIPQTVTHNLI